MTFSFVVSDSAFGDGVDAEMGLAGSRVQCGSSHIRGAKSNRGGYCFCRGERSPQAVRLPLIYL
jgi:hypothetical protein